MEPFTAAGGIGKDGRKVAGGAGLRSGNGQVACRRPAKHTLCQGGGELRHWALRGGPLIDRGLGDLGQQLIGVLLLLEVLLKQFDGIVPAK